MSKSKKTKTPLPTGLDTTGQFLAITKTMQEQLKILIEQTGIDPADIPARIEDILSGGQNIIREKLAEKPKSI
jgi:hypothetical protein